MQAILAEKPDQARKYATPFQSIKKQKYIEIQPCSTFPNGAVIVWAIGHLCEIAPPEAYEREWEQWRLDTLPMIPESFKHQIVRDKRNHFKAVKDQLQKADEIIIATDPAREGELIARLIIKLAGASHKPLKRLWCSSLTPDAIRKAFVELKNGAQTESLYHEALARSYSDWLVGMNSSRAYTLLMRQKGADGVFSTGRVQTPVLCLIRKREQEIEDFKPESFWEIISTFRTEDRQTYQGKLAVERDSRFKEKEKAQEILKIIDGNRGRIKDIKTEQKSQKPPSLHSLSTLQAKLNQRYKLSPSKVLQTVQNLYEMGHISYPRSEFQHLPEAEARELPKVMGTLKQIEAYTDLVQKAHLHRLVGNKRFVDDRKMSTPVENSPKVPE